MYTLFVHDVSGELTETHHFDDLALATQAFMLRSYGEGGVPALVAMGRRDDLLCATDAYRQKIMGLPPLRSDVA